MKTDPRIESYCRRMKDSLWWVDSELRADILEETEAHLSYRHMTGQLEDTLIAFGSPRDYTRKYLRSLYEQPLDRLKMKIFALVEKCASKVSIPLKLLSSTALLLALAKLTRPDIVGIWVEGNTVSLIRGCGFCSTASDPIGMYLVPLMLCSSLLLFLGAGILRNRTWRGWG